MFPAHVYRVASLFLLFLVFSETVRCFLHTSDVPSLCMRNSPFFSIFCFLFRCCLFLVSFDDSGCSSWMKAASCGWTEGCFFLRCSLVAMICALFNAKSTQSQGAQGGEGGRVVWTGSMTLKD